LTRLAKERRRRKRDDTLSCAGE